MLSSPFPPGSHIVTYLRDSGHEDQDLSVDQQEAAIRAWAAASGLILTHIYADRASPGSTTVGRTAFAEMVTHFRLGSAPELGIVLWKYSRFARDLNDAQFFKADLRRRGYIIYSINDQVPDGLDGQFFESAIDWMNARYLEDLRTDIKRGQRHLLTTTGAIGGTPPVGFIRVPVELGTRRDGSPHIAHRWSPDPALVDAIRTAFRLRASHIPVRQIHAALHLYKTLHNYSSFWRNPLYIGELHVAGHVIPNYCEPIVDRPTWDAVQSLNKHHAAIALSGPQNPDHPRRVRSTFILSGLAFCAQCGASLSGDVVSFRSTAKYHYEYYACSGQGRGNGCTALRIPKPALEKAILETLPQFILSPANLTARLAEQAHQQAQAAQQLADQRRQLTNTLATLRRKIQNITDTIADQGRAAPRTLLSTLTALEAEETATLTPLTDLHLKTPPRITDRTEEQWQTAAKALVERLLLNDPQENQRILHGLVSKIVVERDKTAPILRGHITYYLPPTLNEFAASQPADGESETFMPMDQCPRCVTYHTHKIDYSY